MASLASESLLGQGRETRGVLLVDMVRLDERRLLGLDDPVAGLNALRSAREKGGCQSGPSSLDVSVVEE